MNKLVGALGFMTVALAGSTGYLARELSVERARVTVLEKAAEAVRSAARHASASVPQPVAAASLARPAAVVDAAATTASAPAAKEPRPPVYSLIPDKSVREALARDELSRYTDPVRRAALVTRAKVELRGPFIGTAKAVGLTAEEEARLLDLLVDQHLRLQEAYARCNLDMTIDCGRKRFARDQEEAKQEQLAMLGADRFERFDRFRDSFAERHQTQELRSRLPESEALSDAQAEQLAGTLYEERRKFTDEAKERGDDLGILAMDSGQILTGVARTAPDRNAAALQSGEEFSRRMRERAAEVLTSSQMKTYEQIQDELLSFHRDNTRQQEIMESARPRVQPPH